jgi:trehalose-6-phosphatase
MQASLSAPPARLGMAARHGCEYANIADGWTGLVAKLLQPRRVSHHSDDTVHILRPPRP